MNLVSMLDKSLSYTYDSRKIKQGDYFICLPKGEQYIQSALDKGAVDIIQLNRKEFAVEANKYFDFPTEKISLIGITGTNGKTSVSAFVAQLLESFGFNVLVIGTITNSLTTPESWDILQSINQHIDNGGTHVVLEVSSHGIDQFRVYGFDFDIKCLTNISQDHLDYHKTFEAYRNTKMHFMEHYSGKSIYVSDIEKLNANEFFHIQGDFHIENVSAAFEICKEIGMPSADLKKFLSRLSAPKGRFEAINIGQPFKVIIDFAHTPDALEVILKNAHKLKQPSEGKCIVVFGCGGDRDRTKREIMGSISDKLSDFIILTSDNSRSENAMDIISDIEKGLTNNNYKIIEDRQDAIRFAISIAKKGDVILIAGKGHENNQYEDGYFFSYNDHDVVFFELIQKVSILGKKWELDMLNTDSEIIFVSKNFPANQVNLIHNHQRVIKKPSNQKIKQYLQKIKSKKILIIENVERHSLTKLLTVSYHHFSGCISYTFDDDKSLEYNLAGLTLIDQTNLPLVIGVNPDKYPNIKQLVSIIQPNMIIIGDIFDEYRVVSQSHISNCLTMLKNIGENIDVILSDQMTDLTDPLMNLTIAAQLDILPISNWIDFYELVIKKVIGVKTIDSDYIRAFILRYFQASGWYQKVFISEFKIPIFLLRWGDNKLEVKQKIESLTKRSSDVIHYVLSDDLANELIEEVQEIALLQQHKIYMISKDMVETSKFKQISSIKDSITDNDDNIHFIWVGNDKAIKEVMKEIL